MNLAPVALAFLVGIHLFAPQLRFIHYVPRSRWLSCAGGIAIAYVFAHLLPELAASQLALGGLSVVARWRLDEAIYLVALVGLIVFYGLESLAVHSKRVQQAALGDDRTSAFVYWLHIGSFALYNLLIGYLLTHREDPSLAGLALYTLAMAGHFIVNDFGLRDKHKDRYERSGRWLLAAAIVGGWLLGRLTEVGGITIGLLFGFLGGGVILNTIKEEVPEQLQSRFLPFLLGAAGYTALLHLI